MLISGAFWVLVTKYFLVTRADGRSLKGAIAQLGERLLCKQEVVGSIPSGSTRRRRLPDAALHARSREHKSARLGFRPACVMSDIVKRRSIRVPRAAFRSCGVARAISMHCEMQVRGRRSRRFRMCVFHRALCRQSLTAMPSDRSCEANWSF